MIQNYHSAVFFPSANWSKLLATDSNCPLSCVQVQW
jgi:hypothetical protein